MATFSFAGFCPNTMLERSKLPRRRITLNPRPPFPPFTEETAMQKVRLAEDSWNTRDPQRVSLAYSR